MNGLDLIGKQVKFATRKGKGVVGQGEIVDYIESPKQWIVRYNYTVDDGPYKGMEITSRVCVLKKEMEVL